MKYEIPTVTKIEGGRRIAIGDIHGCLKTFKALITTINPTKNDQIFILGDIIDKGKHSKEVIDVIMDFQTVGYSFHVVRGNHEQAFLSAYQCGFEFFVTYLDQNQTDDFLDDLEKYLTFFSELPYCLDLEDWLVCHAPFLINEQSLYRGMEGLFPKINFKLDNLPAKKQVVGHVVETLEMIEAAITQKNQVILLDSGCVYKNNEGLGYLSALDLDSYELITQENID
ncbi:MAG: metallophosphoesterase family protein [Saprospiraceae bacterium]